MKELRLDFVSFELREGEFIAFLPLSTVTSHRNLTQLLKSSSQRYAKAIARLKRLVAVIEAAKSGGRRIEAIQMWHLGDEVFKLVNALSRLSLQIDGLYEHLSRHVPISKSRVEKAVAFRRYLPDKSIIPHSFAWARCDKLPRQAAYRLRAVEGAKGIDCNGNDRFSC